MQIEFVTAPLGSNTSPLALLVDQDKLPASLDPVVIEAAKASRFSGKVGQLHESFVSKDGAVVRLALAGMGEAKAKDRIAALERAGAAVTAKYIASGENTVTIDLSGAGLSVPEAAAVVLGARLRGWRYDKYRTKLPTDQQASLKTIRIAGAPEGTEAAWQIEAALADGVELTRELVTEPANIIYPESFVERVKPRAEKAGLKVRVLDDKEMAKLGMGALLGVAQGSVRPARILVLEWNGGKAGEKPTAFVGKGVTFDTGGISIKPSTSMHEMKADMSGAAAVMATVQAIASLGLPVSVTGYVCAAENMPSGKAQKPGDVLHTYGGKTVEVLDTDAEGRLVLADGLMRAQEDKPDVIIDIATLTGAQTIALGSRTAGIMANDDDLREAVFDAANRAGENMWPMPQPEELRAGLDSLVADIANIPLSGRRDGGMLSASIFLREFVADSQRWAHLDIAGPAYNGYGPWGCTPKGGTGFAVRTLVQLAEDMADGTV